MTIIRIDPANPQPDLLGPAVEWLRRDGAVVFPTETFYGIAVDPRSTAAVAALFALKGRTPDAALPLVADSVSQVESLCGPLPRSATRLAKHFWPGPLSLVLPVHGELAPAVTGRGETVAIRVAGHPVTRALAGAWGAPLTATSANRRGEPPARRVEDLGDLGRDSRVLIIDGGPTPGGQPSTIVDARGTDVRLVRDGAIAWNRVLESLQG